MSGKSLEILETSRCGNHVFSILVNLTIIVERYPHLHPYTTPTIATSIIPPAVSPLSPPRSSISSVTTLRFSLVLLHHYRVLPRKYYDIRHQPLPNCSHYPLHHVVISPHRYPHLTHHHYHNHHHHLAPCNPRQSWILESMLWIPDLRSWIPDSLSMELDYSRFQSLAVFRNPRTQDSRFHKQTFPGFQILQPNFRGISEDRLGFWNPCCGFWIPGPGFRIPSQWNLDSGSQSLAVFRIPKAQDSRFHEQTFLGFQILQPNLREISEDSIGF